MQPLLAPPRNVYTTAQVMDAITGPVLRPDFGIEILDDNDSLVSVATASCSAITVDRDSQAIIHGSVNFSITLDAPLNWGVARARPFYLLSGIRFNQGVYVLTTPKTNLSETPVTYDVTGFDKLYLLSTDIGDTYSVKKGANALAAISTAILAGDPTAFGKINLDQSAVDKTLSADMVWTQDEANTPTFLQVVNDILEAIGYQAIWADWDGHYRANKSLLPQDQSVEWEFDLTDIDNVIVLEDRELDADQYGRPNYWKFVQSGRDTPPTATDGMYVVQDLEHQALLNGRIQRKVEYLNASDQAALVAQGNAVVAEDRQLDETWALTTGALPLAWHRDVVSYIDPALIDARRMVGLSWTMVLDGSDMEWTMQTALTDGLNRGTKPSDILLPGGAVIIG